MPHPFEQLGRGDHHDRAASDRDASYEAGCVSYLAGKLHLPVAKTMARLAQSNDAGLVTLRDFSAAYSTFPILLGADRLANYTPLHLNNDAMLPALFKSFSQAPFVLAYDRFYEARSREAGDRLLGLIFPRNGVRGGLVIYAAPAPDALPLCPLDAMFVYAGGNRKDRCWLVVRLFQKLIEGIHSGGHGWTPADG